MNETPGKWRHCCLREFIYDFCYSPKKGIPFQQCPCEYYYLYHYVRTYLVGYCMPSLCVFKIDGIVRVSKYIMCTLEINFLPVRKNIGIMFLHHLYSITEMKCGYDPLFFVLTIAHFYKDSMKYSLRYSYYVYFKCKRYLQFSEH